jgi:hypothetical protein
MANSKSKSFFGQRVRVCKLCGAKRLCEWSDDANPGPICFHGIECVGRQSTNARRAERGASDAR